VVLTVCLTGYVAGCSVSPDNSDPVKPEKDRKSPEHLIEFFADAYQRKDIDKYLESLADDYQFEFDPQDYDSAGVSADKPWWGKTEDRTSTTHMFEDALVSHIEMVLTIEGGPWTGQDGLLYRLEPSIKVTVDGQGGQEETTYWVFSSWFDVEIIEDPYDEDLWVFKSITEIVKNP
jgi:hypothetical protein